MPHAFLSDAWLDAARELRATLGRLGADAGSAIPTVRLNLTVTAVPFGDGTLERHVDTSAGAADLEPGHLSDSDVALTTDYETAKAIFVGQDPAAGLQALLGGKVVVQGDLMKLLGLNAAIAADPQAAALASAVQAITA